MVSDYSDTGKAASSFTPSIRLVADDVGLVNIVTLHMGLGRRIDPTKYDLAGLRELRCHAEHQMGYL